MSNFVVCLHTVVGVLGTWIFSFKYISNGVMAIFEITVKDEAYGYFKYGFFFLTFFLIFGMSQTKSIEKLKNVAIVGIAFLLYLVFCFVYLTPQYYDYYSRRDQISFSWFKFDMYFLKTFGICLVIFLNQFTILPICNNVRDPTFSRSSKIVYRTIIFLITIYVVIIFCGTMSEPDDTKNEIFLLRTPLDRDYAVLIGKLGFGLTLLIAVMVKSKYLFLYFHELVSNFGKVFYSSEGFYEESEDESPEEENKEDLQADSKDKEKLKEAKEEPKEIKEEKQKSNEKQERLLERSGSESEIVDEPKSMSTVVTEFFVIFFICLAAIGLMEKLTFLMSLAGSFIGYFELIVFPMWLVLKINSQKKFLSAVWPPVMIFWGIVIGIGCASSIVYNFTI